MNDMLNKEVSSALKIPIEKINKWVQKKYVIITKEQGGFRIDLLKEPAISEIDLAHKKEYLLNK